MFRKKKVSLPHFFLPFFFSSHESLCVFAHFIMMGVFVVVLNRGKVFFCLLVVFFAFVVVNPEKSFSGGVLGAAVAGNSFVIFFSPFFVICTK